MQDPLKLRDFEDLNFKEVHDIIFPADVRENDIVRVKFRLSGQNEEPQTVRLWKMSPLGVELLVPMPSRLDQGKLLDLELKIGKQVISLQGTVVESGSELKGLELIVIRLNSPSKPPSPTSEERRKSSRWICSSQFYPVAVAPNPSQYNDFIYLTVRDIAGGGFRALTSLRNKFLVPGVFLDMQISFPMTGYSSIRARIVRTSLTSESGKDYLEIGFEFSNLLTSQKETIGQYLVQFSNAESLSDVNSAGFRPPSFSLGVDFRYIKSLSDFQQVLELRLLANRGVGKIPDSYSAASMADRFDSTSRILVGKFNGKIVGTIRLRLAELGDTLEHEQYVTLPKTFPPTNQIVECSRAATHPDYRRGDLWYSLIQHITIATLRANRSFIVMSTTKELLPMYKKLGIQETGITFEIPIYPGVEQHLMHVNVAEMLSGIKVGPIAWAMVWQKAAEFVDNQQTNGAKQLISTRLRLYRLYAPMARVLGLLSLPRSKKKK